MTQYPDTVRFQPLFLYELSWDLLGFVILFWLSRRFAKRLRNGDLFLLYLIWAPLGRFFIEFMRTDSWFFPGTPFNPVHLITACMIISASIILFLRLRNRQPLTEPVEPEATDTTSDVLVTEEAENETALTENETEETGHETIATEMKAEEAENEKTVTEEAENEKKDIVL